MGRSISTHDVKRFIITTLALEDLNPEDLQDDTPLFEGGLGLDSIDTLELGIALRKQYGIQLGDDFSVKERLGSVQALTDFLAALPEEA